MTFGAIQKSSLDISEISFINMIIATIVPNNFYASWEFVKCMFAIAPKYSIHYAQGPYLFMNRNRVFEVAKYKKDSILYIDSDIIFKKEDVEKMERHLEKYDAVTGVCLHGLFPHDPMLWMKTDKDYHLTTTPDTFSQVGAAGGAFLGISAKVVEALPQNPFDNVFEDGNTHGEDISVCHRITGLGYQLFCDPAIKVGHLREEVIYP